MSRQRDMRRLRRVAARLERGGPRNVIGSRLYRWRQLRAALSPDGASVALARRLCEKSRARQVFEQILLVLRYRLNADLYYTHGLFEAERYARAGDWISHRQVASLMNALNPDGRKAVTTDKALFARHCADHGLPHPATLGVWDPGSEERPGFDAEFRATARENGVVCKQQSGTRGEGFTILHSADGEAWTISDGGPDTSATDWPAVRKKLAAQRTPMLCQRRLFNHPSFADFGAAPLNTVRVLSVCRAGQVEVLMAVWRVGHRGNVADNFKRGGIGFAIDVSNGELGRGAVFASDCMPGSRTATEDGIAVAGRTMPLWRDIADMAKQIHASLDDFPFLSQDIAVTDHGVMAMEVNQVWSVDLLQKVHDTGLGATPFLRHALAAVEDAGL